MIPQPSSSAWVHNAHMNYRMIGMVRACGLNGALVLRHRIARFGQRGS
jgi:hypothetical protein